MLSFLPRSRRGTACRARVSIHLDVLSSRRDLLFIVLACPTTLPGRSTPCPPHTAPRTRMLGWGAACCAPTCHSVSTTRDLHFAVGASRRVSCVAPHLQPPVKSLRPFTIAPSPTPRRMSVAPNQRRFTLRTCRRQGRRAARHNLAQAGRPGNRRDAPNSEILIVTHFESLDLARYAAQTGVRA